ncbi:hypothetical protein EX30DRAFT_388034 [Ascodesmis nigricans]|uniref:Uncharacterized protein n=1 Tax=Ascodesmis nigricans TaxID=341454 RepID=A0A4S2MR59_9PEZI|nr:hypothetical protein EX30DRAFT_388034 [Ascodesmis nigricans]
MSPSGTPFDPFAAPDYDILIGISQATIQKQLQLLYDTKADDEDFPAPGEVTDPDGTIRKPAKHLINHDLHILLPRVSKKGKVYPPEERKGTMGHYMDDDGDIDVVNVNDWFFTFEADLSTSKPMDIMKEILGPVNDSKNPVTISQKAIEGFRALAEINSQPEAVDLRVFLASSIFCLFESTQIASTFRMHPPPGIEAKILKTTQGVLGSIDSYFTSMKSAPGLPTKENPFVLGYSITQTLPSIDQITEATTEKTPRYFIPRRFDFSVTPIQPNSNGIPGCLNFCLQTFRNNARDQKDVDITITPGAGVFSLVPLAEYRDRRCPRQTRYPTLYVFALSADNAGVWDLTLLSSSILPQKDASGELHIERLKENDEQNGYGATIKVKRRNVEGLLEDLLENYMLSNRFAGNSVFQGNSALKDITENFTTNIMMPGGEAFMFAGIDTDQFNNLYSNINYATQTGGEHKEKELNWRGEEKK